MNWNKKTKYFLILIISIITIIITFIAINWFKKEEKFIWTIIPEKEYNLNILYPREEWDNESNNLNSWSILVSETLKADERESIIKNLKLLCDFWSAKMIRSSTMGPILKKNIVENLNERYKLWTLPDLVLETCSWMDDLYLEQIIKYLRWDDEVIVIYNEENNKKIDELIKNLKFNDKWIDNKKLKNDSEYFKEVFFKINLIPIMSVYFSDYMIYKNEPKEFFKAYSFNSFDVKNQYTEKLLQKFNTFLKDLDFQWIEDFRNSLMKSYNISNVDELVRDINEKYSQLEQKLSDKQKIDLKEKLKHVQAMENFYLSNDFQNLKNDVELYNAFIELWRLHLIFSIVNNDYADGLDEPWSWKEFFKNESNWKYIPRVWYIYMLEQSNL